MKYGYETADAFTVAFKRMHGINPAAVKENGVSLKAYPRLTFTLLVKGVTEMNYRIEEKEDIRTVGVVIKHRRKIIRYRTFGESVMKTAQRKNSAKHLRASR